MAEEELLPDADVSIQWGETPDAADHYTCVDENVGSLNINDWIWVTGGMGNLTDILGFPDTIDDVDEVTSIEVNVYYGSMDADESPSGKVTVDINLGGWQGSKDMSKPHAAGWEAFTWTSLSGSQSDLDGLQVKFYSDGLGSGKYIGDSYQVYAVYIDVTYTPTEGVWTHKFIGVANASIGKINGVSIANIGKVNGV